MDLVIKDNIFTYFNKIILIWKKRTSQKIKTPFRRNSVLLTIYYAAPMSPCFLILLMLLMWHYTTQWSPGKFSSLLFTSTMLRKW